MEESNKLKHALDHDSISVIYSKLKTSTDKYNLAKYLNDQEMKKEVVNNHQIDIKYDHQYAVEGWTSPELGDNISYKYGCWIQDSYAIEAYDTTADKPILPGENQEVDDKDDEYEDGENYLGKISKTTSFYIREDGIYFLDKLIYSYNNGKNNKYFFFNNNDYFYFHLIIFEPNKIAILRLSTYFPHYVIQDSKKLKSFIKTVDFNTLLITLENDNKFAICLDSKNDMFICENIYKKVEVKQTKSNPTSKIRILTKCVFVKNNKIIRIYHGDNYLDDYFFERIILKYKYKFINKIYDGTDNNLDILIEIFNIINLKFDTDYEYLSKQNFYGSPKKNFIISNIQYNDLIKYNELLVRYMSKQ